MPVIKVNPSGETFEYEAGSTLLELLLAQKFFDKRLIKRGLEVAIVY